jgi:hypothetical protein
MLIGRKAQEDPLMGFSKLGSERREEPLYVGREQGTGAPLLGHG